MPNILLKFVCRSSGDRIQSEEINDLILHSGGDDGLGLIHGESRHSELAQSLGLQSLQKKEKRSS